MSTPDSGPHSPAPRTRRWLVPLLVASLGFNLVIVGAAVSGQVWSDHSERRGFHSAADLLPRSFFKGLHDERRHQIVDVFRARKPEYREERRALTAAAGALADALERESFEPQLAQSAIADHARSSHQLVDLVATVAGDLVGTLTTDERRALAQAIRHRIEEEQERRQRRSR